MDGKSAFRKLTAEFGDELFKPLVEVSGDNRVLVEHHGGITKYECDHIEIKMRYGPLQILGTDLMIVQASREQLVITGKISKLCLHGWQKQ